MASGQLVTPLVTLSYWTPKPPNFYINCEAKSSNDFSGIDFQNLITQFSIYLLEDDPLSLHYTGLCCWQTKLPRVSCRH